MSKSTTTREELIDCITACGYPREFGELVAQELGGEWSMRRMIGYLRGAKPTTMEQIADEMLAILEHRHAIVEKKMSEKAQNTVSQFYNRDRSTDETDPADA